MSTATNNPVGRPRSFDEDKVLGMVIDVFWRKGYEATSMNDLLNATGLHKGSLYQAFGDKHSLFIRALRVYIENMRVNMQRISTEAERAIDGLRAVICHHIDESDLGQGVNAGCMALNSLVENAQHDPEVLQILGSAYRMRLNLMTTLVERAQSEGDLRGDWQPGRIANLIAATEAGILVERKGMLDAAGAKAMVDDLLESLR